MGDSTLMKNGIKPFSILQVGIESSFKIPSAALRGNASYNRFYISNRLFLKLKLEQSASFYNQKFAFFTRKNLAEEPVYNTNQQLAYYAKLSYPVTASISFIGAYHYLQNNYAGTIYQNHVALVGVKLSKPYYEVQGDADLSKMANANVNQYNLGLTVYPRGNLNLYTVSRLSLQDQLAHKYLMFTQIAGARVSKSTWLEANATLGRLNNYLEADAVYVYNSIDQTLFKTGATAFVSLNKHLLIHVNYAFERKENAYEPYRYSQNSITGGSTWKF